MAISQALARKWRPRAFSELVGQEHVVRALTNALDTGRLHHAWLLTGTRGVGKTTLARILAKCLNCETGVTANPCGECSACRDIDAGRFPDMLEVDAATNTKVEEMRELLENAQYMPVTGRFKVYIIDEVHMLSRSAFNSMLKTLEEPPDHVKFILATTDPQKVPVTVLSRCLQFNLKQMPPELVVQRLSAILDQEGIGYEVRALELIAKAAQGSMRDGLSLLDQAIAFGAGKVAALAVGEMLGVIGQDYLIELLGLLARRDTASLMDQTTLMLERSLSFDQALRDLAALLQDLAVLSLLPEKQEDLGISPALEPVAGAWDAETLQILYQIALQGRRDLPLAPDEAAGFRMTLLRMLAFQPQYTPGSVALGEAGSPGARAAAPARTQAAPAVSPVPPPTAPSNATLPATPADWSDMVRRLTGAGIAYELARNCEMLHYGDGVLQLKLDPAQRTLERYRDKLKSELEARVHAPLRVVIEVGEIMGDTQARAEQREEIRRQETAVDSLRRDPFVQAVVGSLGGKLVESTVKSAGKAGTGEKG